MIMSKVYPLTVQGAFEALADAASAVRQWGEKVTNIERRQRLFEARVNVEDVYRRLQIVEDNQKAMEGTVGRLVVTPASKNPWANQTPGSRAAVLDDHCRERRMFEHGDRVGYILPKPGAYTVQWFGVVIPQPAKFPSHGKTGERFTYVMRDGDHGIRSCYPENLRRV